MLNDLFETMEVHDILIDTLTQFCDPNFRQFRGFTSSKNLVHSLTDPNSILTDNRPFNVYRSDRDSDRGGGTAIICIT